MTAEEVVDRSLRDLERGKVVCVTGDEVPGRTSLHSPVRPPPAVLLAGADHAGFESGSGTAGETT